MARLDKDGNEILDPTPVALPVRFQRPPSLVDDVRRLVAQEMSRVAMDQDFDSFEDADDFDIDDDDQPRSRHELPENYPPVKGFDFKPKPPEVKEEPKPPAEPIPPKE